MNRDTRSSSTKNRVYPGLPIKSQAKAGSIQESTGDFWTNLKGLYSGFAKKFGIKCCEGEQS